MDITPYVESLHRDLSAAAAAGGPDVQAVAERLEHALEPAVRMVLLEALSEATAEISQDLDGGSIDVRLKGREPQFVVTPPPPPAPAAPPPPTAHDETATDADLEDEPVARITLRLPESLKQRAEDAAAKRGQSLNTWLVGAVRLATRDRGTVNVDIDLGSNFPFGGRSHRGGRGPGQSISGWAR